MEIQDCSVGLPDFHSGAQVWGLAFKVRSLVGVVLTSRDPNSSM